MSKSKYAERLSRGKPLLDEILDEHIGRLKRAEPKDRESTLRDWADLAGAEASVKDSYRGRYLFELIQNANDALIDAQGGLDSISTEHHLVRLQLTDQSLLVANYGQPFGPDNVRALCRLHTTTKSASKQIGHKGIGFKSVLEICQTPEVYSDIYAFGYDGEQFRQDVERIMGQHWDPRLPLPMLRVPYPRYINQLPQEERERIEALFDEGYVTVIRLPLTDPRTVKEVADRMGMDGEGDIRPTLLLFMTAISQIELCFPDGREVAYYRQVVPLSETQKVNKVVLYRSDAGGDRIDSRWLVLGPVERQLSDRSLVAELDKAWQDVNALRFSLAFPLADDARSPLVSQASQPFYVYFPTEEPSGLRFAVHADFHVGHDRKTLALNPLNKWLIDEICAYLASDGIELLKQQWPYSHQLVDLLAPSSQPEREFAHAFMQTYLSSLSATPFVPTEGRHYKAPEDICFPPENVDQEQFRRLFPAAKLRGAARWAYPTPEVVESERRRRLPFLLRPELGAKVVTPAMVIDALSRDGMPSIDEAFELIQFLADWYDRLPGGYQRSDFEERLKSIPIFPTTKGWQKPRADGGTVFQANLHSNVNDVVPPAGFEFAVIVRSIYPESGTNSKQYAMFRRLGAREYSARDIVRDAILPVLTNPERFETLLSEHPRSIYETYKLLKEYYLSGGTTYGFQDRLARVPVPATDGTPGGWSGWKEAGDCYLGSAWPGGEVLERVYAGFSDCFFLADIPELVNDEAARREWAGFFRWLGVLDRPRVLRSDHVRHSSPDPFQEEFLWSDYMNEHAADFRCRHPTREHGHSRRLDAAYSLHHFADLVRAGDAQKLVDLYSLLARHWAEHYSKYTRTTLNCQYTTTGCPSDEIESYLLYQLKHARWIPAQIGGQVSGLLSPQQIWILGETEPADVRRLVPTLPPELRSDGYRHIAADLGFISPSTAQVEDYVRLLQLLPECYPLEVPEHDEDERKRWHKSISAVFNWICERIQAGLISRGGDGPPRPDNLRVLAYRHEQPCYVDVQSPELVYADNNFLAERWKSHCVYLRINDDWDRLRRWLGIANLSEVVESEWFWEGELEDESRELQERFDQTLPYYLALIKRAQPAHYERLLTRLQRLRVHVVKQLWVQERFKRLLHLKPLVSTGQIHLVKTDEPLPRGGRARSGDLYVTRQVLENLDLLGDYIADYIEIARLGDAFVILINRPSEEDKRRFVESKGAASELAQVMEEFIKREPPIEQAGSDNILDGALQKVQRLERVVMPTPVAPPVVRTERAEAKAGDTVGVQIAPEPLSPLMVEYPALDFDRVTDIIFAEVTEEVTRRPGKPGGGGGKVPRYSEEVTRELGRRGEEWAYEAEKRRLRQLGYDPGELEEMGMLAWVSRVQPTANYDILSIRITETGEERPVYIEVKAGAGTSREIRMGRGEFELALSQKEDYWLYWVANADAAVPDAPVCYPNLARLIEEKKVDLNVDTISIILPKQAGLPIG